MPVTHEPTTKRLVRLYQRTTQEDRERGAGWYAGERRWLMQQWHDLTDQTNDPRNVLSVYAALSPQMPWERNRMLTQMVLRGDSYPGGCFRRSWDRAVAAVTQGPLVLSGPKVISFDCNLAGCTECVTMDVHMMRMSRWPLNGQYEPLVHSLRAAARRCGDVPPAHFQATLWLAYRPERPRDPDERITDAR